MPTLTVAGHDVTVGDEFLKLSPEDQQSMVNHIAQHLPNDKPSGVAAGLANGISGAISGPASTIGLTGASTPTLDAAAKATEPANYKSAPIFDKDGVHLSNIPQALAEAAPGLATDFMAGKAGAKIGSTVGGVRGGSIGGIGGFLGSALLRNFGPGAHANADARTGVPDSPVETKDLTREASKQALEAIPNIALGGRLVPGATKALAESALAKLGTTAAIGAGAGVANDAINQVGTTAGSKDGVKYDWHGGANAATTGALLSSAVAAPRAGAEVIANRANGRFEVDPETRSAATDVANRIKEAADGKSLVGPLGSTKNAEAVKATVHGDIHRELADAAKGEQVLSTANNNTLSRIQEGGTASRKELSALAAEADPETVRLARQAVISGQVKATGGLSGAMDQLSLIKNPVKSIAGAGLIGGGLAHAGIAGSLGAVAPAALGTLFGAYGTARAIDKLSGQRSPLAGFTDRFADGSPVRADAPATPVDPFNPSAGPWGARGEPGMPSVAPPQDAVAPQPSLRATLNANSKVEEGMAKIAKGLGDQKRKSMIADAIPALQQLAASRQPPAPPEATPAPPFISPVALKMTQARLKAGLPPEPVATPPAAPEPPPAPVISPIAQKMLNQKLKQGLPPEPAPPAQPPMPSFNPTALSMLKAKMKQGLTDAAPASPGIAAAMQQVAAHDPAATPAPPAAPAPPLIAKITKKMGKPVEATPAPEAEQPYTPIPEEGLWRKRLSDEQVADAELSKYSPKVQAKYRGNIIENRSNKRDITEAIANEHSPADAQIAADLYHQLDTHSRRTEARKAIKHYTAHMSAAAAAAVHSHFSEKAMEAMWHSE